MNEVCCKKYAIRWWWKSCDARRWYRIRLYHVSFHKDTRDISTEMQENTDGAVQWQCSRHARLTAVVLFSNTSRMNMTLSHKTQNIENTSTVRVYNAQRRQFISVVTFYQCATLFGCTEMHWIDDIWMFWKAVFIQVKLHPLDSISTVAYWDFRKRSQFPFPFVPFSVQSPPLSSPFP